MLDFTNQTASFFPDQQSAPTKGEKYVIFCLGAEFFAVFSDKVVEVVQMLAVTPLPNVPEWLLGIADLRGTIVSVVSLQKLLGKTDAPIFSRTKFVVLKSSDFSTSVALAVDRVSEIVVLSDKEITSLNDPKTPFILGNALYKSNHLTLLNVEKLFSSLTI